MASDQLIVDGLAGNDVVSASIAQAGAPALVFEGGDGNDTALIEGGSTPTPSPSRRTAPSARRFRHLTWTSVRPNRWSSTAESGDDTFRPSATGRAHQPDPRWRRGQRHAARRQRSTTSCSAATATTSSTATSGSDIAQMGAGDDTFQWDPGDGSDIVEGGRQRHDALQRRQHRREHGGVGERARALFTRNSPPSPWT
jgi:Ca2+-binding RTX toxin-like protein